MKMKLILVTSALVFTAVAVSRAAIHDITVASTVGTGTVAAMRMFVPDNLAVVRGLLIFGNGAGSDDRAAANRAQYQAFAESVGFAVVATSRFDRYMRSAAEIGDNFHSWAPPGGGGDGRRLLEGLAQLAEASAHPEILDAPVIFWGFSGGGQMAYEYNAWKPERTIAFSANKGGFYTTRVCTEAARRTPAMLVAGELDTADRRAHLAEVYATNRALGAQWAFLLEQGRGHQEGNVDAVLLPFFRAMIAARYPADASPARGPVTLRDVDASAAWLADPTTTATPGGMTLIAPAADYTGSATNPNWLADRNAAYLFRGLATFNNPLRLQLASGGTTTVAAGASVKLTCDTSAFAGWSRIEFYDGGVKVGEVTAGAAAEVTLSSLTAGPHGIVAVGYDANGTARTSNPVLVVVRPAAEPAVLGRLVNLAVRARVVAGDGALIMGFVFDGNVSKRLLVRAVGPGLAPFGVAETLVDPQLAVYRDGVDRAVGQNDDWAGGAALAADFGRAGAFALDATSKDAALAVTLAPGAYTAHVRGAAGASGVALVEVYELP